MPKRTNTPGIGQLGRSSPYAADPASLVQCARRRLQYSQLPVRCSTRRSGQLQQQQQQQQQNGKLVSSLKKFQVLGSQKRSVSAKSSCCPEDAPSTARFIAVASGSPTGRKSLSMSDLSPTVVTIGDFEHNDLRSDSGTSSARLEDGISDRRTEESLSVDGCALMTWPVSSEHHGYNVEAKEARESRAASLICRSLTINAWRRRREEVSELRGALAGLGQQLDHLQLQIVVLRRLLDNENARVASLAGELHRTKAQVDDLTRERDQLKIEKETAEGVAQKQREVTEEQLVTAENLRNELRTSRDQLDALDKQIARDREKLLKLREDKKILLEKVSAGEALVAERTSRADKAEALLEDAQMQLATQITLMTSLQEELQRFSNLLKDREEEKAELEKALLKMEEENTKVEERLGASEATARALSLRAAELESELFNQESKIKRVEAAYSAQVLELNELRDRLLRQSQESGWSSRVLQLAGSVVRAPRVILRTLSFFSSGMPPIL